MVKLALMSNLAGLVRILLADKFCQRTKITILLRSFFAKSSDFPGNCGVVGTLYAICWISVHICALYTAAMLCISAAAGLFGGVRAGRGRRALAARRGLACVPMGVPHPPPPALGVATKGVGGERRPMGLYTIAVTEPSGRRFRAEGRRKEDAYCGEESTGRGCYH